VRASGCYNAPMPRILLLLPSTTYQARDFLDAARKMGVLVTVGTDHRQALESLTPATTLGMNFLAPEAAAKTVLRFAGKYPIDAVHGVDDDTSVLAAHLAHALGLPHNAPAATEAARDKHRRRVLLREGGLPYPWFERFAVTDDPEACAARASYPCVLKPIFLAASRGVIRVDDPAGFVAAFRRIATLLADEAVVRRGREAARWILAEGYLPGGEVALEGLLTRGELTVLALFDKPDPLEGPYFEETIYVTPSRLPEETRRAIAERTAQACAALGLRHGPVHAELRFNPSGVYLLEVAPRVIGGLCARTLRFGTGMSLEEVVLRHAVGAPIPTLEREGRAAGVMMLPIPGRGRFVEVRGRDAALEVPGVEDLQITIPRGDVVVPLPEGHRYLGFLFARGADPAAVEAALREGYRRLEIVIE